MKQKTIRAVAICVFKKNDSIFVYEGYDPLKKETHYRPLGGGIEFGEHSEQTVIRELQEEINAEITNLRYLKTIENIFVYNGKDEHEIVVIYEGDFVDQSFYNKQSIIGQEDTGETFKALWKPLADLQSGETPLYPPGLLELLL